MKKTVMFIVGGVLLFILLLFGDLLYYRYFGPAYQNVERQVFENTKSYTYGVVQDLAKYHHEWEHADRTGKRAIENLVRQRFANFDVDKIRNNELRVWVKRILGD